jgi:hypothetical protein
MARMTKQDVEAKIDAALAAGQIYNVELTEIKDALSRMVENALEVANDIGLKIYHAEYDRTGNHSTINSPFEEIRYSQRYPHNIPALFKKLPKTVAPQWEPALAAYKQFFAEWLPLCQKFIALKKLPVVKGKKPVEAAAAQNIDRAALTQEKYQLQAKLGHGTLGSQMIARSRIREINALLRANDAMKFGESPIFKAVLPLKEEAMEYARKNAVQQVEVRRGVMEKFGWDIDAAAPRPIPTKTTGWGRDQKVVVQGDSKKVTEEKNGRRFALLAICDGGEGIVRFSQAAATRFVEGAMKEAAVDFDAFVSKLDNKVQAHDTAEIEGRPWIGSIITITKGDVTERWHTQQIINYSVYGKPYNQWPTRLLPNRRDA